MCTKIFIYSNAYFYIAVLNSTTKNALSSLLCYVFSSTKLVIRAEQDLPGTERGKGERVREWGRGEK
jgi:hypothetical protein